MAENLQHLLERIQKDGIEKAEAEAQSIVSKAREQAAAMLKEAEEKRQAFLAKAEQDADLFVERGRKSLEQAARDVVLSVKEAVKNTLQAVVEDRVRPALDSDMLPEMIAKVVESYASQSAGGMDILVSKADRERVVDYFMKELQDAIHQGCTIRGSERIVSGFQVSMDHGRVWHDFSGTAIAEAMSALVRPHLAEIVRAAGEEREEAAGSGE